MSGKAERQVWEGRTSGLGRPNASKPYSKYDNCTPSIYKEISDYFQVSIYSSKLNLDLHAWNEIQFEH